ncbi:PilW family protein, partial [Shewanella sp.]
INNGMNNEEQLVEGIENMRILYGFDSDGDGTADSYMPVQNVTTLMWDNELFQRLVSLKVFLLVRSSEEDHTYTNDNTYKLGDKTIGPLNDKFRRKVVSSTIILENPILINL